MGMEFNQFMDAAEANSVELVEYYGEEDHPEVSHRKGVDDNIKKGLSPSISHEASHGKVDLSNAESKARLAATLARVSKGKKAKSPATAEGSKSILAQDQEQADQENGKQ